MKRTERLAAGAHRHQVASLPFRLGPVLQIMLITSRETKRWIIPKGWPMKGKTPFQAAAIEAQEEAGLIGEVSQKSIGSYIYWKAIKGKNFTACHVDVFPLKVTGQLDTWREQGERECRWFFAQDAETAVFEPGLKALIADFALQLESV